MVTVHIHRDFKIYHNHLIFFILRDHAKVRRARKVAAGFKESMRIVFDKHLGQWNYVAMPEAAIL